MKKIGYIIAIIMAFYALLEAFVYIQGGAGVKIGTMTINAGLWGLVVSALGIGAIIGAIAGFKSKPWSKNLTLGTVIALAILAALIRGLSIETGLAVIAVVVLLIGK